MKHNKRTIIIKMNPKTYRYVMKMVNYENKIGTQHETISSIIGKLIAFWAATQNESDQVSDKEEE